MGVSFNQLSYTPDETYNNILVVDSLNLSFRYKHSKTQQFSTKLYSTISSLAKSYNAKKVFVLGDWGSSYRKNLYSLYKANREKLRAEQTEEERIAFEDFLKEYSRGIELCNTIFKTIRLKGVEADDIAAFIVKHISPEAYDHIWLISTDKDWDQLISKKCSRFAYTTRKEITVENWGEHYPYKIEDHISVKVLQGDKGDNVPGCAGIGEKRAYNILRTYGPTAIDVLMSLPIDAPQIFIQNLNKFGDQIELNYELMDLLTYCDDAIGDQMGDLLIEIQDYINED